MKQQRQSRLDGGTELDRSQRKFLPVTVQELPGQHLLEERKSAAEGRPPVSMYSQAFLQGCHQILMPSYRLPQNVGTRQVLDEVGMHCHDSSVSPAAFPPIWDADEDTEHVIAISNSPQDGVAQLLPTKTLSSTPTSLH